MRSYYLNLEFKIVYDERMLHQFKKMEKQATKRVIVWINSRLISCTNPRLWGKKLQGSVLGDNWCYRIGDYRLLCNIDDKDKIIFIAGIGHRREIYKQN